MSNRRSNLGSYQDQSIELKEKYDGNLDAYKEDLREEGRQEVYEEWREDTEKREKEEWIVTLLAALAGGCVAIVAQKAAPVIRPKLHQVANFIKEKLPAQKNEAMLENEEEDEDAPGKEDDEDEANPV
ncbi:MAG: hypothetical protein LUG55_11320 [Clostridiales bacterium]|nr:hypothetical protein [Clostridiales bacterium]